MEITFLGYQLLDFVNKDGQPIKGCKFYFCFQSEKANYHGLEVASYFADFVKDRILYDLCQKCLSGQRYEASLTPSFSGKTKITNLTPIK